MFASGLLPPAWSGTGTEEEIASIVEFLPLCERNSPKARPAPLQCRYSSRPYVPIACWYSVNPIPAQTAAMIQKRSMIFVSDQAISSKW